MSPPLRGAMAAGYTPPPFVRGKRRRTRPHTGRGPGGWWKGLNSQGKMAMYIVALLGISLVATLAFSSGDGNSATVRPKVDRAPEATLKNITEAISEGLLSLELELGSLKLKSLLRKISAIAPMIQSKLARISKVVQGARCQGYIATLEVVSDSGGKEPTQVATRAPMPDSPEGMWRYARRLAQANLPLFQMLQDEALAGHAELLALAVPVPQGPRHKLLLENSGLALRALSNYVRALELIKDVNEMTVGQAVELFQKASGMILGAAVSLDH